MENGTPYPSGNAILDRFSEAERSDLLPGLTVIPTDAATLLRRRDEPVDFVHFPIDAAFSVVGELNGGHAYEVNSIGRFDVVGAEFLLGTDVAARTVLCQVGGSAMRVDAGVCASACRRSGTLRNALFESLRRQWFTIEQTLVCNRAHGVVERAARWILMTADQTGRSRFVLRHEYLSMMLGVPKPDVAFPLGHLTAEGALACSDELLSIVSRSALQEAACECYAIPDTAPFVTRSIEY